MAYTLVKSVTTYPSKTHLVAENSSGEKYFAGVNGNTAELTVGALDNIGNTRWLVGTGGFTQAAYDGPRKLVFSSDGDPVLVGYAMGKSRDVFISKLDKTSGSPRPGFPKWYDGGSSRADEPADALVRGGDLIVVGKASQSVGCKAWALKINLSNGAVISHRQWNIDVNGFNSATSVAYSPVDGALLIGAAHAGSVSVTKLSPDLSRQIWQVRESTGGAIHQVLIDKNQHLICVGSRRVFKYSASGGRYWSAGINSEPHQGNCVLNPSTNDVIVSGPVGVVLESAEVRGLTSVGGVTAWRLVGGRSEAVSGWFGSNLLALTQGPDYSAIARVIGPNGAALFTQTLPHRVEIQHFEIGEIAGPQTSKQSFVVLRDGGILFSTHSGWDLFR